MKKFVYIVVLVLVLIVGGYFLFNYLSEPKLISLNSEPISTCTDTDGNNIYEKGFSDYILPDGTKRGLEDACDYSSQYSKQNVGVVRESYCDGKTFKTELWTCGRGNICRGGRCIQGDSTYPLCSDGDGGIEPKVIGSVMAANGVGTDSCWTSTNKNNPELDGGFGTDCSNSGSVGCYVYEYYCSSDGNTKEHKIISCEKGCQNGVCL